MQKLDESNADGTPLTQEQLEYFAESERRASTAVLRKFQRNAIIGFVTLLLGVGFNVYDVRHHASEQSRAVVQSGTVVAVEGCNRDFRSLVALRGVLQTARTQVRRAVRAGRISKEQGDEALKFYKEQLGKLKLPDCRKTEGLLTNDLNHSTLPPIPRPLYPHRDSRGGGDD